MLGSSIQEKASICKVLALYQYPSNIQSWCSQFSNTSDSVRLPGNIHPVVTADFRPRKVNIFGILGWRTRAGTRQAWCRVTCADRPAGELSKLIVWIQLSAEEGRACGYWLSILRTAHDVHNIAYKSDLNHLKSVAGRNLRHSLDTAFL